MTDVHNDILADEDFDTILSPDIDFTGRVTFEKSLLVQGSITGSITAKGTLLVDTEARVEAGISADRVIIRGKVRGDVTARNGVAIESTGRLAGDLRTPEVLMESGCRYNGRCTMEGNE